MNIYRCLDWPILQCGQIFSSIRQLKKNYRPHGKSHEKKLRYVKYESTRRPHTNIEHETAFFKENESEVNLESSQNELRE